MYYLLITDDFGRSWNVLVTGGTFRATHSEFGGFQP